jgi:hypothetical protein
MQPDGRVVVPATRPAAAKPPARADAIEPGTLPSAWPKPAMDVAVRNPFAPPSMPLPKVLPQPPVTTAPLLAPTPPPASYRFWGRMSSPDKHTSLFLAKGQDGLPVPVQAGTHFDDGWSVETIGDNTIVLANAATQQRTTIFVPPAEAAAPR